MFILRKVSSAGVQMNFELGRSYTVVDRFFAYEDFKRSFKEYYQKDHVADLDPTSDDNCKRVHAFVSNEDGNAIHPLHMGQESYIMTTSGNTFSNLTCRS